jgi:DNA repair protein RecO (recombination protein O)
MDYQRAEGIVLRRQPVTETSLIVTWFTREFGKLRTLAKGARRTKGPFVGKIDLFYQDELVFLTSRRSDLHLLHDCFLETPRAELRTSVARLTAASYCVELVDLITPVEDGQSAMFELLEQVLDALSAVRDGRVLLLWIEMQILAAAGWKPAWRETRGLERALRSLLGASVAGARRVRFSDAQLGEARDLVWRCWDDAVGRAPRSRAGLEKSPK